MSTRKRPPPLAPKPIMDIFGENWMITRRIDSGHGFDLLYGQQPYVDTGSTWHLIVDEALEAFILDNLYASHLDLPIGVNRRARLRRIISSRRYNSLEDWEKNRDKSEPVFHVDPEHIQLPELIDVNGHIFSPVEIRYFKPGFYIWMGTPDKTKDALGTGSATVHERSTRRYVLTKELAELLYESRYLPTHELSSLKLPLRLETVRQLRIKAIAHFKPDLLVLKAENAPQNHIPHQTAQKYMRDGIVADIRGHRYRVSTISKSEDGDIILRGRSMQQANSAGHELIITPEIAAVIDAHQGYGSNLTLAKRFGVHSVTIGKIRKRYNFPKHDPHVWWVEHVDDLLNLLPQAFADKHSIPYSIGANRRYLARYLLKCKKGEGRGKAFIKDLKSKQSLDDIAKTHGYKSGSSLEEMKTVFCILQRAGKM